jgi:hypothetical protein
MTTFQLRTLRPCVAALVALTASTTLLAQPQPQPEVSVDALVSQAQATFRQIDARAGAAVWDSASPLMQNALKKDAFLARIENDRADMGPIAGRMWTGITRTFNPGTGTDRIPAGNYVNVSFLAQDGNGKLLNELISFRLENDRTWRMTGYVSQKVISK